MSKWNEAIQKMFDETNFEDVKITRKDFEQACKNIVGELIYNKYQKNKYEDDKNLKGLAVAAMTMAFGSRMEGRDVEILRAAINRDYLFDEVSNVN